MRIRADSVFISSVLFTIALVCLIPAALRNALAGRDKMALASLDAGFRAEAQTAGYLGVACLAIILIGLIVIWTAYVKRARSAWLVMFVVAWIWAFPLFVWPLFKGTVVLTFSEWLYSAIYQSGSPRIWAESVLIFLLMVIALLLPIKSIFLVREIEEPIHRPSPKLIGGSAVAVLLSMTALLAWIHFQVYEIPPDALSSWQQLPPPPPPPQTPCKVR
ncbi:MAG TPA: hypothetical protein VJK29_16345 [Terriglobales bacterium]|nr:hypothetical protein [Terriglobales bacterium]